MEQQKTGIVADRKLTDLEVTREIFTAGYLQAITDFAEVPNEHGSSLACNYALNKLKAKAALVSSRAAIATANKGAA